MTSGIGADDSLPANLYKVKSRFSDEENVVWLKMDSRELRDQELQQRSQ
jgi:hypothetical protein